MDYLQKLSNNFVVGAVAGIIILAVTLSLSRCEMAMGDHVIIELPKDTNMGGIEFTDNALYYSTFPKEGEMTIHRVYTNETKTITFKGIQNSPENSTK